MTQQTLIGFESYRKDNNIIPPVGSNSFYDVGSGGINILSKKNSSNIYKFELFIDKGEVFTGPGNFIVSSDDISIYESINVISNTSLKVNHVMTISNGKMEVHGTLDLMQNSQLIVKNNSDVIFYTDSIFSIQNHTKIIVESGSSLTIYGLINVQLGSVYNVLNAQNVTIDSAAVMNVNGMEALGPRHFSMTDYYTELSERIINIHTQGEKNFSDGRIGYKWTYGTPTNCSQVIEMDVLWGEAILGDFKLSALGIPETDIPNLQMISDVHIYKDTIMYITDEYNGNTYINPELYLGIVIGNNSRPANCEVDGTLIVDGSHCMITVDRGATIHINESGKLYLRNNAIMRSTYNENTEVLYIDGTLIIDNISQIDTFDMDNIVFGDNGKVIILNPDTGEKQLLWTTPNGIEESDLYRLFKDTIDHIEYHISNNTGIGIDQYYDFYARDMTNWFGGRRIEKAIHDGILVWHDGGFIELYHDITPWVDTSCTLLEASRIFKTYGSYDKDKLQDAVNRLRYAGCGNILFRFINGKNVGEVMMVLESIKMKNILNYPMTDMYILNTDNDGELFLRNKVGEPTPENIITNKSRVVDVLNNKAEFILK